MFAIASRRRKPARLPQALGALLTLALAACAQTPGVVGFRTETMSDASSRPIEIGVWYPSEGVEAPLERELRGFDAVLDGTPVGERLPLIVMSHGNNGSYTNHVDTALALARAGFVTAALTHDGDNYRDQSRATDMAARPRQLHALIDHMLTVSPLASHLDAEEIGAFGFSSGGFSVLALAGGTPDMSRIAAHCEEHPDFFDCGLVAEHGAAETAVWTHDPRIKAVVSAAPALGFTFGPDELAGVGAPVQLWRAEQDDLLPHPHYAEAVRLALPTPPEMHVVPGARHFAFLAPCSDRARPILGRICEDPAGFDRAAFHDQFNREVVRFLLMQLGKS